VTLTQTVVAFLGLAGLALTVAGLLVRGTVRTARAFLAYLAFMFVAAVLVMLWPGRFFTWQFWVFKQIVFDALELGTLAELGYWTFLGFPGAARQARSVVLLLLVGTFVAVVMLPTAHDQAGPMLGFLRPRLEIGIAWTFTALAGLVSWYEIPVRPIHRAIMLGLVIHLVIFGTVVQILGEFGLRWNTLLATLQPAAFVAITMWWAREAWRREPALAVDPALAQMLQPWRKTS
jgi:hypothetical protein